MYSLPGLSLRAAELVAELTTEAFPDWTPKVGRSPKLDVVGALRLSLCWLRRNMTFEELGKDFGIGTRTAWEYAHGMAEFLAETLGCPAELLKGQVAGKICLVDGTLIPTCNWRHPRDLHSGHRKHYGVIVQIICDAHGRLDACSKEFPGSWHDKHCFDEAGLAAILAGCGGLMSELFPMTGDQPFWAHRLTTLGVSPATIRFTRLTTDRLAATIREVINNPIYTQRAAALAAKISTEDGATRVLDTVTELRH